MDQKTQELVDKQREVAKKFLDSGELQKAETFMYDCQISVAGAGANFVNVDFKNGVSFSGGFGPGVGAYTGWGGAFCNKRVEEMKGWSAGFTIELIGILGGTAHMQIANADAGFICQCSTSGIGIGGGLGAGGGKFS